MKMRNPFRRTESRAELAVRALAKTLDEDILPDILGKFRIVADTLEQMAGQIDKNFEEIGDSFQAQRTYNLRNVEILQGVAEDLENQRRILRLALR